MLPPEILVLVFSLACSSQFRPCPTETNTPDPDGNGHPFMKEPVVLSHVCSRWRQVAVNSASLWSHIDLYPDQFRDPMLPVRAETYISRSIQSLLDVHILVPDPEPLTDVNDTIMPFPATIAPRTWSLNVMSTLGYPCGDFYRMALATCFENCMPNILSEISTQTGLGLGRDWVLREFIQGGSPSATTEVLLLSVRVLRLTCFNFDWTSKAYHGLTELRTNNCYAPNQFELRSIFQSSPQLRVLELGEVGVSLQHAPLAPVRLDNLEILSLLSIKDSYLGAVLRLIEPGLKPLSLSILNPYWGHSDFTSRGEFQSFIDRSNIT
ncbi:hypothetical protein FRC11_013678 [Ceratobasidium sp. 423]|nr:hypothetical protein FRC11_013678 [Ceratobasidium sp. 423]